MTRDGAEVLGRERRAGGLGLRVKRSDPSSIDGFTRNERDLEEKPAPAIVDYFGRI